MTRMNKLAGSYKMHLQDSYYHWLTSSDTGTKSGQLLEWADINGQTGQGDMCDNGKQTEF